MTDQEWTEMFEVVKQRYLDEGKPEAKARKLTQEYMRQVRLDEARASLAKQAEKDKRAAETKEADARYLAAAYETYANARVGSIEDDILGDDAFGWRPKSKK